MILAPGGGERERERLINSFKHIGAEACPCVRGGLLTKSNIDPLSSKRAQGHATQIYCQVSLKFKKKSKLIRNLKQ